MGTGQKSVGSRLWDVPVWLGLGQEGSPLAWPHQPKPTQEMPTDHNIRAPNLLWLAGNTRLPELNSWQRWQAGTMTLMLKGCSTPVHSPTAREGSRANKQKTSRQQREPGVPLDGGHCTVVGIQFHAPSRRTVRGPPLLDTPGRRLVGRQLLTLSRRRHCGD